MVWTNGFQDLEDLKGLQLVKMSLPAKICKQHTSSLVGLITRAPKPSDGPHFRLYRISSKGTRKARVFPLPVLAAPSTSFICRDTGILDFWMSVIVVKKAFLRPIIYCCFSMVKNNRT